MIALDDDGFADLACAFTGRTGRDVCRLADVVPLGWSGADCIGVCGPAADVFRDEAALAADFGAEVPQCLVLLGGVLERAAQARPSWTVLGRLREPVRRRLGDDTGGSVLRAVCGCHTCMTLREPGGWSKLLGEAPAAEFPGWDDDLPPAERRPVPLADVTMPLVPFVKTLHPEQRVLAADGVIMSASDFVRTIKIKRRDRHGRVIMDRLGRAVEDSIDVGRSVETGRAATAYPGQGALSLSVQPAGPRTDPDVQLDRFRASGGADWADLAGQSDPAGRRVQLHLESCLWCSRPGPYAPGVHGTARPLVVLCSDCDADFAAVRDQPDGWRYIVQPGHGLESRIGRTRMSSAVGPDGAPIFDLTTINPGYRPLVLSILPADLLAHDRHGEVQPVAEWIARILRARKP